MSVCNNDNSNGFADQNKDGILSWEDFNTLAEYYTMVQRKGKLEKDVYERWKSILEKWWNELTMHADYNKVNHVTFLYLCRRCAA